MSYTYKRVACHADDTLALIQESAKDDWEPVFTLPSRISDTTVHVFFKKYIQSDLVNVIGEEKLARALFDTLRNWTDAFTFNDDLFPLHLGIDTSDLDCKELAKRVLDELDKNKRR